MSLFNSHRFIAEIIATDRKHLDQVAQTRFVAYPPQHDQHQDVSRAVQVVERRSGSLIELSVTAMAAENAIA